MRVPFLLAVAAAVAFSGCMGAPSTTRVTADGGFVSTGYAYDGNGTDSATMMRLEVDDEANTGRVDASWREGAGTYRIEWTRFAPHGNRTDQQGGGIVRGVEAHGATGNGDASLPQVHYLSAGWGTGEVFADGAGLVDPATGQNVYGLHYMLVRDGVRDPITHRILAKDGKGLFSPARPEDALTHPNSNELILIVQSLGDGVPERLNKNATAFSTSPTVLNQVSTRARMGVPEHSDRFTVWVNLSSPASAGQTIIRIKDPNGKVEQESVLNMQTRAVKYDRADPLTGNWTLEAVEQAPGAAHRITWHTHQPRIDPWFRMLTFESPNIERREGASTASVSS